MITSSDTAHNKKKIKINKSSMTNFQSLSKNVPCLKLPRKDRGRLRLQLEQSEDPRRRGRSVSDPPQPPAAICSLLSPPSSATAKRIQLIDVELAKIELTGLVRLNQSSLSTDWLTSSQQRSNQSDLISWLWSSLLIDWSLSSTLSGEPLVS